MNIAVLGGGVEGTAIKKYFASDENHVQIFDNFKDEDVPEFHLDDYDLIFRSPSVHPWWINKSVKSTEVNSDNWTSNTNYFFENCKAPVIGVTGTKGKGTMSSMIKAILEEVIKNSEWKSRTVHLIGNYGVPAIEELDKIANDDIVVFELSSFQLWDLFVKCKPGEANPPHIAVVGRVEPDHLDRHKDFADYVSAKSNITTYQKPEDYCIYYGDNQVSKEISECSAGTRIDYTKSNIPSEFLDCLTIPGQHNRENASAAINAAAAFFHMNLDEFLAENGDAVKTALKNFKSLPHRLEYVTTKNNVDYYDDNYSSAFPALDVALKAFEDRPVILIAGGKDRHLDLTETKNRIFRNAKNLKRVILIGETAETLAKDEDPAKYEIADSLERAVYLAGKTAEKIAEDINSNYDLCIPATNAAKNGEAPKNPVVLMSPGAASFDMFKNFSDRGDQFKKLVL
ncbi:MAG: UDP-N-acetylmuramoyl-L-alanine--D-glutamate ligase [Candidatus Saccharibacteria bacterium]|nr:UDP-N-acetylmuramoyl-L-alanine--D-glutamate ligase [Candidatus Saccharibacteria bacterium]